jgi:hypothetical protein
MSINSLTKYHGGVIERDGTSHIIAGRFYFEVKEEINALRRNKDIIEACIMDRYRKILFSYTAEALEDKQDAVD